jgi:hypothetical protein
MITDPLPGFAVAKMPAYRLIVRHMPWGLSAPYNVTPRYAAAMVRWGSA